MDDMFSTIEYFNNTIDDIFDQNQRILDEVWENRLDADEDTIGIDEPDEEDTDTF